MLNTFVLDTSLVAVAAAAGRWQGVDDGALGGQPACHVGRLRRGGGAAGGVERVSAPAGPCGSAGGWCLCGVSSGPEEVSGVRGDGHLAVIACCAGWWCWAPCRCACSTSSGSARYMQHVDRLMCLIGSDCRDCTTLRTCLSGECGLTGDLTDQQIHPPRGMTS